MWLVWFGVIDPNGLLAGQQVKRTQMTWNLRKFGSRFLSAIREIKRKRWQNRFWLIYLLLLFRPEKVSLRRAQRVCPRTGLPQSDWLPLPLCIHFSISKHCVCACVKVGVYVSQNTNIYRNKCWLSSRFRRGAPCFWTKPQTEVQ